MYALPRSSGVLSGEWRMCYVSEYRTEAEDGVVDSGFRIKLLLSLMLLLFLLLLLPFLLYSDS
jgi:hypothetical protein